MPWMSLKCYTKELGDSCCEKPILLIIWMPRSKGKATFDLRVQRGTANLSITSGCRCAIDKFDKYVQQTIIFHCPEQFASEPCHFDIYMWCLLIAVPFGVGWVLAYRLRNRAGSYHHVGWKTPHVSTDQPWGAICFHRRDVQWRSLTHRNLKGIGKGWFAATRVPDWCWLLQITPPRNRSLEPQNGCES